MTALAFAGDILLAGEGRYLKAHHVSSNVSNTVCVFEAQAIHGFAVHNVSKQISLLVAWGGPYVRVLLLTFPEPVKSVSQCVSK